MSGVKNRSQMAVKYFGQEMLHRENKSISSNNHKTLFDTEAQSSGKRLA
jgi:hypothetical protein